MKKNISNRKVGVRNDRRSSEKDTLHFLTKLQSDLTLSNICVDTFCVDTEEELDFIESLIEENQ